MAKKSVLGVLVALAIWISGVIVSLAVGLALVNGTLVVPYVGALNVIAGWVVVVLTILGIIGALVKK
ncbi:hypothetical protein FJZ17_00365 [Candidatus Pacearchaeota archaeon]|nr:hypothetical protein [Candidatus Pacearchaeota archaeon]